MRRRLALPLAAALVLPIIGPPVAAHADQVIVTIDDAFAMPRGDGTATIVIDISSDADCTFWGPVQLDAAFPVPGGVPKGSSKRSSYFVFNLPQVTNHLHATNYQLRAGAVCEGHLWFSENVQLTVPNYDPPQDVPPPKAPPASIKNKNLQNGKNSLGSGKRRGKVVRGQAGVRPAAVPLDVTDDAAAILDAASARDAWISFLLGELTDLPDPTAAYTVPVVAGPSPTVPALPASLSAASAADVRAALANRGDQIALGSAAVEAMARRNAALTAADAVSAAKRSVEAAGLLDRWASAMAAQAALDVAAQADIASLVSPVTLTADELTAAQASTTAPAGVAAALVTLGAPPAATYTVLAGIQDLSVSSLTNYTPSLAGTDVSGSDQQTSLDLRRLNAALVAPGVGAATSAVPGPRLAKGVGQLRKIGCVAVSHAQAPGCTIGRGLSGAKYAATSPDGRFVYVGADGSPGVISVFSRSLKSGALTQLKGKAGCYSAGLSDCTTIPHSARVNDLEVSTDGKGLVAALYGDGAVISFSRNVKTGALKWVNCIGEATGCKKGPGKSMFGIKVLTLSPDGRNVYAASLNGVAIVELARARTGKLSVIGCIGRADYGCALSRAITSPAGVAISRDGAYVYEADVSGWAVSALARNTRTGVLTDSSCVSGRDGATSITGCSPGLGLAGPEWVTAGPAGSVWVGSSEDSSVVRLQLDASGNLAMAAVSGACTTDLAIAFGSASLCAGQPGLSGAYGVAVSPDGLNAYVGSYDPGSLDAFQVDPVSGALTGVGPCFGVPDSGCPKTTGLAHAGHTVLTPDGRNVMILAPDSSSITVFARRLAPTATTFSTSRAIVHKGKIAVTVRCPVTATAWCYGSWTAQLAVGGKVKLRTKATELVVKPGGKAVLTVLVPAAVLKGITGKSKLKLTVVATSREPFGAKKVAKKAIPVHRG
ncbi:hypothetical protein acdb102_35430 [Acidothermaceae bacterium B102]|nr:hypothetical protein acdb102_35430 [Acidothermaceae bacterium B102]